MGETPLLSSLPAPVGPNVTQKRIAQPDEDALRQAARDMETAFLSEMLKAANIGAPRATFGGGQGEEQFSSMLRDEYARALSTRGGIGLAEQIFNAMLASQSRADSAARGQGQ